jgi:5'-3' exonuclease
MEFIRSQRSSPEHDPNTRHVLYGLVGQLSMQSTLLLTLIVGRRSYNAWAGCA